MEDSDDASDLLLRNVTEVSRSRPRTRQPVSAVTNTTSTAAAATAATAAPTRFPAYYIPKRPRVIKMRDLSEATKARIAKEYFEAYDPWTGVRIAATLGILISMFTLFLIYKSKYHRTRNNIITSKKTSLYLYDEELECDLDNVVASSDDTGSFAFSYRYADRLPKEYHFGVNNQNYPLEEVFVKSSMAECVALTVHKNQKNSKGPKYGTLRITKDSSHSLPCSPYQKKKLQGEPDGDGDEVCVIENAPFSPVSPEYPSSLSGSITSFGSSDSVGRCEKAVYSAQREETSRSSNKLEKDLSDKEGSPVAQGAKRPQDYRSRSSVVAIGRRKRKT